LSWPARLAVYGSLAPGQANHHQLAGLQGSWSSGTVRGRLLPPGWGAALGYPGLMLDPAADEIAVQILTSDDLPRHWARLDDFEGEGYRRTIVMVMTAQGEIPACLYVLAAEGVD